MIPFSEIIDIAALRHGGHDVLEAKLSTPVASEALAATADDRWLSNMSRIVFQAGISWTVVEKKWPGIEDAFENFHVGRWVLMSDADESRLMSDSRVIRSLSKVRSVCTNAQMLQNWIIEYGSVGQYMARTTPVDFLPLITHMKKSGGRMGGKTAQYSLRMMGVDSVVFSNSVCAALVRFNVVDKAPTSQRDMKTAMDAILAWADETGRPITHISQILALSTDP